MTESIEYPVNSLLKSLGRQICTYVWVGLDLDKKLKEGSLTLNEVERASSLVRLTKSFPDDRFIVFGSDFNITLLDTKTKCEFIFNRTEKGTWVGGGDGLTFNPKEVIKLVNCCKSFLRAKHNLEGKLDILKERVLRRQAREALNKKYENI